MSSVVEFKPKGEGDPLDDVAMCVVEVFGNGDISLIVNTYVETQEQHNWLIAKLVEASSRLVDRKAEIEL